MLLPHRGGGKIQELARDEEKNSVLYFIPEKCVGCGTCESVCQRDAITIYREGRNFNALLTNCAVCGICSDFCQFGALRFYRDGEWGSIYGKILSDELGFKKIEVSDNCILCSLCMQNCPRDAIKVVRAVDLKKIRKGTVEIKEGCINCRLCVENCPTKAVRIYHGKPVVDEEKCIYCEICSRVCPVNVIEVRCDSCRVYLQSEKAVYGEVVVDESSCSTCGICGEVCPVDAIKVRKIFDGNQIWDGGKCFGDCTVCRDICPNEAIQYYYEPDKVVSFSERCNYCGTCERYCPGGAIKIERKLSEEISIELKKKDRKSRKVIRANNHCLGCGICTSICPLSGDGATIEIINGEVLAKESFDCTACGLCMTYCPVEGIEVKEVVE